MRRAGRLPALAALLVAHLAGCDRITGLALDLHVPPRSQAGITAGHPVQLVVKVSGTSLDALGGVATLCANTRTERVFLWWVSWVRCAERKHVEAWLVPVASEHVSEVTCAEGLDEDTPLGGEGPILGAFDDDRPWAETPAFEGAGRYWCQAVLEHDALVLEDPTQVRPGVP